MAAWSAALAAPRTAHLLASFLPGGGGAGGAAAPPLRPTCLALPPPPAAATGGDRGGAYLGTPITPGVTPQPSFWSNPVEGGTQAAAAALSPLATAGLAAGGGTAVASPYGWEQRLHEGAMDTPGLAAGSGRAGGEGGAEGASVGAAAQRNRQQEHQRRESVRDGFVGEIETMAGEAKKRAEAALQVSWGGAGWGWCMVHGAGDGADAMCCEKSARCMGCASGLVANGPWDRAVDIVCREWMHTYCKRQLSSVTPYTLQAGAPQGLLLIAR